MELGIGTVQFGLDYGISNRSGRCPPEEVVRILKRADRLKIHLLDTASAYGQSEQVLGQSLPAGSDFRIVTKLGPFNFSATPSEAEAKVRADYAASRQRLGSRTLHGLLVHNFSDVQGPCGDVLMTALQNFKATGEVEKFGVSVYSAEQIDYVLDHYEIDLIQIPFNILDQRLKESGHLGRLRERNIEIHVRSVFLQGLLLMDCDAVPAFFEPIRPLLRHLKTCAADAGFTPLAAALAFVKSTHEVDAVIVGITREAELVEVAKTWNSIAGLPFDTDQFAISDSAFLNPGNWPADTRSS